MNVSNPQTTNLSGEAFMAFIQDDITSRSMRDIAQSHGWDINRIFDGGMELAIDMLREVATPQLMVIDLTGCYDPLEKIEELASICDPGVRLVCLGTTNDVALYRDLLEMGVDDYLLKPIDPDTFNHVIDRALEAPQPSEDQQPEKMGELMTVVGTQGGVGTSSIALNLAFDLSENKGKSVALVDMDLHFGTLALSMDLEAGKGFREALENPSRIDSLFLDRAMVKVNDRLSLLACETDLDVTCRFEPESLDLLLQRLRQKYDFVVLDLPLSYVPACGDLLVGQGKFMVVSDLSLAGMRDSLRLSRFWKDNASDQEFLLMANRVGENKDRELAVKEFESGVEIKLAGEIPFDAKSFGMAETRGEAVLKTTPKAKSSQALQAVFKPFGQSEEEAAKKPSLMQRILGVK